MGSEHSHNFVPLQELTSTGSISYGIVQPGQHSDHGIPIVRVNNINNGQLDLSSPLKVDPAIDEKHSKTRLEGGEVLLSLVGTTGQCVVAGPELRGWNVARAIAVIKPALGVSAEWITICLKSQEAQHYLNGRANTTVQKTLNLKDVRQLPIMQFSKTKENYILHWWTTLNDKIELNRKMNATLEAMAQALFKSWFVDFDPVIDNALRAGNPIPEPLQQRAETRKEVLSVELGVLKEDLANNPAVEECIQNSTFFTHHSKFPSSFTHSEDLGWIPEGWEICSLESLLILIGGGTPKTSVDEYWNGDIPWFSVVDAPDDSDVFVLDTQKHVTQAGVDNSSTKTLRPGTTIISARGTVGKCAIVGTEMAMNQSCYGIQGAEGISDEYTYYSIRHYVSDLQQRGHGSVFNTITGNTFKSILVPFSDSKLTTSFSESTSALLQKIKANLQQQRDLTKLRDTLLPKLISGELSLLEIEKSKVT